MTWKLTRVYQPKILILNVPRKWFYHYAFSNFWTVNKQEEEKKNFDDFEFTKFDIVPKHHFSLNDILPESDRNEANLKVNLSLYQILVVEIVNHLKSDNFNKEFSPFVKNQNTYINLWNLHIRLLTHGLLNNKHTADKSSSVLSRVRQSYEIK